MRCGDGEVFLDLDDDLVRLFALQIEAMNDNRRFSSRCVVVERTGRNLELGVAELRELTRLHGLRVIYEEVRLTVSGCVAARKRNRCGRPSTSGKCPVRYR